MNSEVVQFMSIFLLHHRLGFECWNQFQLELVLLMKGINALPNTFIFADAFPDILVKNGISKAQLLFVCAAAEAVGGRFVHQILRQA